MNKDQLLKKLFQLYENDKAYSKDKRPLKTLLTKKWQDKITQENLEILIRKIEDSNEAEKIYRFIK